MRSDDVDVLSALVTAANSWQNTAATQNVVITILTVTINGEVVKLSWDATNSIWDITAD